MIPGSRRILLGTGANGPGSVLLTSTLVPCLLSVTVSTRHRGSILQQLDFGGTRGLLSRAYSFFNSAGCGQRASPAITVSNARCWSTLMKRYAVASAVCISCAQVRDRSLVRRMKPGLGTNNYPRTRRRAWIGLFLPSSPWRHAKCYRLHSAARTELYVIMVEGNAACGINQ